MKIFKVVLIVLLSVIGVAGIILLGVYLSGGFNENRIYPANIFFANVTVVDESNIYSERGSIPYDKTENFKLIISSSTLDFNQGDVTLSFRTNQTGSIVRYLKKVNLNETFAGGNVFSYYANDSDGNVIRFVSCGESQAQYITNGVIIVPIKVSLNKYFDALVCIAPEDVNEELDIITNTETGEVTVSTKLYNIGGYSHLIALSSNLKASSTSAYINIDVPVEKIDIIGITNENISETNVLGLNEELLTLTAPNAEGVIETEVGVDSLFSVVLDITPARAVYKYGRNGDIGVAQYKTVIFSLNADEGLIAFASSENNPLPDVKIASGVKYVYSKGTALTDLFGESFKAEDYTITWNYSDYLNVINSVEIKDGKIFVNVKNTSVGADFEINIIATSKGDGTVLNSKIYGNDNSLKNGAGTLTTTLGSKFVAKTVIGKSQIHVGIFKNAVLENEAIASVGTNLASLFTLINSPLYGITKTSTFDVKEIAIEGFDITDKYNQGAGTELDLTINKPTIIYANNPDSDYSLGIDIRSNISAQNRIKNILLSVQYSRDGGATWFDATQVQNVEINSQPVSIPALFGFYTGNEILTKASLGLSEEDSLYTFNFYRPVSSSNMSYWEIVATSATENIESYGIDLIKIFVYYLNPESKLMLDSENYGPYPVDTIINEPAPQNVDWNVIENSKTNEYLGAGNYNERFLIGEDERISLQNILKITTENGSTPTYTTVRYFIYSSITDLDNMLNVEKYNGIIDGISGSGIQIYEIDSQSDYLICRTLLEGYNEIEFKLTFAIVEHLPNGNPVLDTEGFYKIIKLPKDSYDDVVYAPFKIQKVLNDVQVEIDKNTETGDDVNGTISPYTDSRIDNTYFLQSTRENIRISISVDDADLFVKLAQDRKIVLSATYINNQTACNDIYLYYKEGNEEYAVELADVLATIFEDGAKDEFNGVLKVSEDGLKYTITLSTKTIDFATTDEKGVKINLTYTLEGDNIPDTYTNPKIAQTSNFYIYSGKIKDIYFGTKDSEVVPGYDEKIYIDKTVVGNQFSTSIYVYLSEDDPLQKTTIGSLFGENFYLNVYLKQFGLGDAYIVSSSNLDVAQVVYNSEDGKYAINFLKAGEVTIFLKPDPKYKHSEAQEKQLMFVITSNYTLEDKYGEDVGIEKDDRVESYSSLTYKVIGQANISSDEISLIDFNTLIKILAIQGESSADVTSKFKFYLSYDISTIEDLIYVEGTNPLGKIELQNGDNGLTGFIIKNHFGTGTLIVVSAVSSELGFTFIFNIKITPYEQISAIISEHEGAPSETDADSNAVFAESDINVIDFKYQHYDIENKQYNLFPDIPNLQYTVYDKNGNIINQITVLPSSTSVDINNNDGDLVLTLTFDNLILTKIVFAPVKKSTRYVMVITRADSLGNVYDMEKEIAFYVSPNIKVDENSLNNEATIGEKGIIYLNNSQNPVLNGETISVETIDGNNIVLTIGTQIIRFIRQYGSENFISSQIAINEDGISITVSDAKKLGERELTLSYAGREIKIVYYVAPNIRISDSANKVTYNGEQYIALYAGQDISNLTNWFISEGSPAMKQCEIYSIKNILSLARLYDLASKNSVNLVEDGNIYYITKNSDGLIETSIVISHGTGTARAYRVFKVLIFPMEWEYVKYSSATSNSDVKDVLNGEYQEEINTSGTIIISENFVPNSTFDLYVANNFIKYDIYLITASGETQIVNNNQNSIYIAFSDGKLKLITQPIGEDREYRIKFTYTATTIGYPNAKYEFSYYIKIKKTQEISINYPYGASGTEGTLEDFVNYQNIYYSQFSNGNYVIDLNSAIRNVNGKFVQLKVGTTKKDQSDLNLEAYNKLTFEIYKVYNQSVTPVKEITSNLADYITVTANGVVTLKDVGIKVAYIIKISTPNGAVNYYKIMTQARPAGAQVVASENFNIYDNGSDEATVATSGTQISSSDIILIEGGSLDIGEISKSFNLSFLTASGVQGDYKFALIDNDGKILTANSMLYIIEYIIEKDEIQYIVVKTSANEQRAKLIVYTEKDGIIEEIEVLAESSYKVEFDDSLKSYGASTIDIAKYLTVTMGAHVLTNAEKDGLTYNLIFNDSGYNKYITCISGSTFNVNLINTTRTFNITVEIYGGILNLNGNNEQKCVLSFNLVVSTNITPNTNVANTKGSTTANQSPFTINTNLFDYNGEGSFAGTDHYYDIILSLEGTGEYVSLSAGSPSSLSSLKNGMTDLNNAILLYIKPVSTTKEVTITIKIYKGESASNPTGDVITATYTLTIYPDTLIDVNYPDYDTGGTFTSEYIYWKDYKGTANVINLTERMSYYKVASVPTTAPSVNGKTTYETIMRFDGGAYTYLSAGTYIVVVGSDEYKVVVVGDGVANPYHAYWYKKQSPSNITYESSNTELASVDTDGKVKILKEVTANTDVVIRIFIDGIFRQEYKLTITNDAVFTAKFAGNSATKTEKIADTTVKKDKNIFDINYGEFSVQTKLATADKMFKVTVTATPRIMESVDPIDLYGVGGAQTSLASLYKVGANNTTPSFTNLDKASCDILGVENDADIWTVTGGTSGAIAYKQVGTYMVKIVTTTGEITTISYYLVVVKNTGTAEVPIYTPTYYTAYNKTSLTLQDIFGTTITNYDMYTFNYSTTNSSVVSSVTLVSPSILLTYYYHGYQIPYSKAGEIFKLNCYTDEALTNQKWTSDTTVKKLIQNFRFEYVSYTGDAIAYATRIIKIQNSLGTEVATYVYTIDYDFAFSNSSFDEVTVGSDHTATGKNNISYYYVKSAPDINLSGKTIWQVKINKKTGADGGLTYTGGKFVATGVGTYDVVVSYSDKSVITYSVTTAHEFENYTTSKDYLVSKIIELDAISLNSSITGYDLIELLINKLGLTALNGLPFKKADFKSNATLYYYDTTNGYGSYTSNARYVNNISGILGTSVIQPETGETLGSYNIIPYGAKNGGDIVHLTLNFANKFYVLRIKIKPTVTLVSKNSNGEFSTKYYGTEDQIKYALSNFVTLNGIDPSKIEISVLDDSDSQYVTEEGKSNRLMSYGTGSTTSDYGIKLHKTVLGGAKIRFKISDAYGYVVTDSTQGSPMSVLTLYYMNASETIPKIDSDNSTKNIYEGNNINIVYSYKDGETTKYKVYNFGTLTWGEGITALGDVKNPIIINSIGGISDITDLTPSFTAKTTALNGILKITDSNGIGTNLLANTRFDSEGKISGTTFELKLSYANGLINETARINLNITVNQKYTIQFKDPYDNYSDLYLRNGVSYNISDLIQIIDNEKEEGSPERIKSPSSISELVASKFDGVTYINTSDLLSIINDGNVLKATQNNSLMYTNRIADGGIQYVQVSHDGKDFLLPISFKITPYYYEIDSSYVDTYSSYGVLVSGSGTSLDAPLTTWGIKYLLKDYYGYIFSDVNEAPTDTNITILEGNSHSVSFESGEALQFTAEGEYIIYINSAIYKVVVIESGSKFTPTYYKYDTISDNEQLSYEKEDGQGTVKETGNITGMQAGDSITVKIKADGVIIETVKVTMRKYNSLFGGEANIYESDGILPFESSNGTGWGEGISAVVAGTGTLEQIAGEGLFSYSSSAGIIKYNQILGCNVISNYGSAESITIDVYYMGQSIGRIKLTKSNGVWSSSVINN